MEETSKTEPSGEHGKREEKVPQVKVAFIITPGLRD